jgi:hypothetical protein
MCSVFVFRNSVYNQSDIRGLITSLNEITGNGIWNFDLEDWDKILRVECENNISNNIIRILNNKEFICSELED